MLVYIGHGRRTYGLNPLTPIRRPFWEFQAVLKGRIAPLFPGGEGELQKCRLWIFPPGSEHGWDGDGAAAAEVAVFHFPVAPAPLRETLPPAGYISLGLAARQITRLRELQKQALAGFRQPDAFTHLQQEHLLLELSLLAADAHPTLEIEDKSRGLSGIQTVKRALLWYGDHLSRSPGLDEVGRAVGASPAHLRRLFHKSLGCAPKVALQRLQFQRALDEMSRTTDGLEAIAERCGFGSASAFSRAFKERMGYAPRTWRNALHSSLISEKASRRKIRSNRKAAR
ncbi:MAG: helix-turn-helix transcriptional regulator [Opitutales bacterium]|nr:helix-turn-helix transcriptional regulator [Opitutales bacterium]